MKFNGGGCLALSAPLGTFLSGLLLDPPPIRAFVGQDGISESL